MPVFFHEGRNEREKREKEEKIKYYYWKTNYAFLKRWNWIFVFFGFLFHLFRVRWKWKMIERQPKRNNSTTVFLSLLLCCSDDQEERQIKCQRKRGEERGREIAREAKIKYNQNNGWRRGRSRQVSLITSLFLKVRINHSNNISFSRVQIRRWSKMQRKRRRTCDERVKKTWIENNNNNIDSMRWRQRNSKGTSDDDVEREREGDGEKQEERPAAAAAPTAHSHYAYNETYNFKYWLFARSFVCSVCCVVISFNTPIRRCAHHSHFIQQQRTEKKKWNNKIVCYRVRPIRTNSTWFLMHLVFDHLCAMQFHLFHSYELIQLRCGGPLNIPFHPHYHCLEAN